MKLSDSRSEHLTYCTNIHPGESWFEVKANLERFLPDVKRRLVGVDRLGVGLRLSALAARELAEPGELEQLESWLDANGLYVFTINGFPYGTFHGKPVKEAVYAPDWRDPARLAYTDQLAHLLARLLPAGVPGSISTVPGCFRPDADGPEATSQMARHMLRHVECLWQLAETTGRHLSLALEPEPRCLLETTHEGVAFVEQSLLGAEAIAEFAAATGLSRERSGAVIRSHVGLCLDACHAAVEFEEPAESVAVARRAGIRIVKAQLSCGLEIEAPDQAQRTVLRDFDDPVYLHQTVVAKRSGPDAAPELERLLDLPEALARPVDRSEIWRVHFHVPIFLRELTRFTSTQDYLSELLEIQRTDPFTEHLEVETYTWDVLPEALRTTSVSEAIARELDWVRERLADGALR